MAPSRWINQGKRSENLRPTPKVVHHQKLENPLKEHTPQQRIQPLAKGSAFTGLYALVPAHFSMNFRNGDPYHKGINVVLNMRHAHDINAFLDAISERIGLVSGVKRLYTLNGSQVKRISIHKQNFHIFRSNQQILWKTTKPMLPPPVASCL